MEGNSFTSKFLIMEIKKYNLSVPKEYEKDGEKKTQWQNVGTLTIIEGDKKKKIVEIPAIGLTAYAFPIDGAKIVEGSSEGRLNAADEINPEDIPF
jgi:hypothetical protein